MPSVAAVSGVSAASDDWALTARLVSLLSATRTTDGGWATATGREADAESTAWVLAGAVLLSARVPSMAANAEGALAWLATQQEADGSWTYRRGPVIATWPTHVALLGLTLAEAWQRRTTNGPSLKAVEWVVHEHSALPTSWQRLMAWAVQRVAGQSQPEAEPLVVLNSSLDGFGWARETFPWVEPTAIAMLAMAMQPSTHLESRALRARVRIGAQLLLDRQAPDGGWNYGNTRVLGVDLPSYPDTTGWALLGLAAAQRIGEITAEDVLSARTRGMAALSRPESPTVSPLPVALELLVRRAHRLTAEPAGRPAQDAALNRLRGALVAALDGVSDGYPLLETRTAVLALCALHEVDLLADIGERS